MTSGLKILEAVTTLSKIDELEEGDRDILLRVYRKKLECASHKLQALLQPASNSTTQSVLEVSAPPDFFLTREQIFKHVQAILSEMRDIIKHKPARTNIIEKIWEYSSPELSNGTAKLATKLDQLGEDKFRVLSCKVMHHENGIEGLTYPQPHNVLLFPLNENARFGPNEPLSLYHYIKERRDFHGENIDIVSVVLEKKCCSISGLIR